MDDWPLLCFQSKSLLWVSSLAVTVRAPSDFLATGVANMGIRAGGGLGYLVMPALFSDIDLYGNNEVNTTSDTNIKAEISQRFVIFQSTLAGVSSLFFLMLALVYSHG